MYPDERANRNATVGDFFESMHSEEHERNVKMRIFRHESNFHLPSQEEVMMMKIFWVPPEADDTSRVT